MTHFTKLVAAAMISATFGLTSAPVMAETPPDTLIQAWQLDDMISLDPAEVFEFTASEILGNSYQPLVGYDVNDVSDIFGVIAEKLGGVRRRQDLHLHHQAGHEVRLRQSDHRRRSGLFDPARRQAGQVARVHPDQFGLTADNVDQMVRQTGDMTFEFEMDKAYAPTLVLYCLTATVGFVVDKKLVAEPRGRRRFRL